ncbi:MAG: hypothetical protein HY842_06925, partial [Bacteroidetes bacterium]|nr:hypothetical protein [Bacteroidota bacterium]
AWLFPLTVLAVTLVAFIAQRMIERWRGQAFGEIDPDLGDKKTSVGALAVGFLKTMVAVTLFNLLFLLPGWLAIMVAWLIFPVLFLWAQVMHTERLGIFTGLSRSFSLMAGQFGNMAGLFFTLMLCGTLFFLILDTGLMWYLLDVISMNFFLSEAGSRVFETVAVTAVSVFVLLLVFGLWVAGSGLQYFSSLEANEATFLKKRLELIGKRVRIRGMEREG